jgi:hypothetical protein
MVQRFIDPHTVRLFSVGLAIAWAISGHAAHADCDNPAPNSGQSVTCSPPVEDTTGVTAVPGSTNVTIDVSPGASVSTAGANAITLSDQSQATNHGAISTSGANADGLSATGSGNTLVNEGTITTSGDNSDGMVSDADGNSLRNDGVITVTGADAYGIHMMNGNGSSTFTNTGTINGGILGQNGFENIDLLSGTINGDIVLDRGRRRNSDGRRRKRLNSR